MKRPALIISSWLCLAVLCWFLVVAFASKQKLGGYHQAVLSNQGKHVVVTEALLFTNMAEEVSLEEAKRRINAAGRVWDTQKERIRRLAQDDYPKALAEWNKVPDRQSVILFPDSYLPDSPARDPVAVRHFVSQEREMSFKGYGLNFEQMMLYGAYGHVAAEKAPVGETLSVRQLVQLQVSHEATFKWFCDNTSAIEREIFGDEAATRRVEAFQNGEAMMEHLQGAQQRYLAECERVLKASGYDAQSCAVVIDQHKLDVAKRIAKHYAWTNERQVNKVGGEWNALRYQMDPDLLAQTSRDNAESRRLLTELKDCDELWRRNGYDAHLAQGQLEHEEMLKRARKIDFSAAVYSP